MEFNAKTNLVEKLIYLTDISAEITSQSGQLANKLITAWNMVGLLAVELFIDQGNKV